MAQKAGRGDGPHFSLVMKDSAAVEGVNLLVSAVETPTLRLRSGQAFEKREAWGIPCYCDVGVQEDGVILAEMSAARRFLLMMKSVSR